MRLASAQPAIERAQCERGCDEGGSTSQRRVDLVMRRSSSHDLSTAVGREVGNAHGRRLVGHIDLLMNEKVTNVLSPYGPAPWHGLREFMHERLPFVV